MLILEPLQTRLRRKSTSESISQAVNYVTDDRTATKPKSQKINENELLGEKYFDFISKQYFLII